MDDSLVEDVVISMLQRRRFRRPVIAKLIIKVEVHGFSTGL
jgi:hypothetical protein